MLTGGVSARELYEIWKDLSSPLFSYPVDIYVTDERFVSKFDAASNQRMISETLFKYGVPACFRVFELDPLVGGVEQVVETYNACVPDSLDIIIVTAGKDGHVASIFPNSSLFSSDIYEKTKFAFVPVRGGRFTITPAVLGNARSVYVLAPGKARRLIYDRALEVPDDFASLPVRIVLGRQWIFDPTS